MMIPLSYCAYLEVEENTNGRRQDDVALDRVKVFVADDPLGLRHSVGRLAH